MSDRVIVKLQQHNMTLNYNNYNDSRLVFAEGFSEAATTLNRLVTVILPDGNHVNSIIHSMETALEIKQQLLKQYHISLSEYEVVLCKENKQHENVVLQDAEEFCNDLYNFDYIEIRSRQQHMETIQAMQSCIDWKTPLNSF